RSSALRMRPRRRDAIAAMIAMTARAMIVHSATVFVMALVSVPVRAPHGQGSFGPARSLANVQSTLMPEADHSGDRGARPLHRLWRGGRGGVGKACLPFFRRSDVVTAVARWVRSLGMTHALLPPKHTRVGEVVARTAARPHTRTFPRNRRRLPCVRCSQWRSR